MLLRAAMLVVFVLLALFAWRGWKELPTLARFAATAATGLAIGLLVLRSPGLFLAAALLSWAIASWISARPR